MKKIGKKFSPLIITLCIYTSLQPTNALATSALNGSLASIESTVSVTPYSDIIDWRYKSENGNIYKRLYNYSTQEWIGEWILCP
ncbi:hypothetical protein HNQ56_000593 [Anaerotaenia torta]|uniref:hypothetical protein n=1 Tax=Anaerotaenia torta TaxID=433293 RepID=UPI003D1A0957